PEVDPPNPPFNFTYAYGKETTINRAADYVQAHANMRTNDFLKLRPDIEIILETSVLLPGGLDHMIEVAWGQDLGLLNLDYDYIKKTLEEGPYAGIAKFDAEHFPKYFEEREKREQVKAAELMDYGKIGKSDVCGGS
ncbi:hypothetical protein HK097_001609, partial [Rhizophlyctis rosea]